MRTLILIIVSFSLLAQVHANELESAYQKEFAYLVAEKRALEQRLANMKSSQDQRLQQVQADISKLEGAYLGKRKRVKAHFDERGRIISRFKFNA